MSVAISNIAAPGLLARDAAHTLILVRPDLTARQVAAVVNLLLRDGPPPVT